MPNHLLLLKVKLSLRQGCLTRMTSTHDVGGDKYNMRIYLTYSGRDGPKNTCLNFRSVSGGPQPQEIMQKEILFYWWMTVRPETHGLWEKLLSHLQTRRNFLGGAFGFGMNSGGSHFSDRVWSVKL